MIAGQNEDDGEKYGFWFSSKTELPRNFGNRMVVK